MAAKSSAALTANPRLGRILVSQMAEAVKSDHPNLMFAYEESDVARWYILILNLGGPYADGEYIAVLDASRVEGGRTFPHIPPSFSVLTPNGVYELGGPICISIGEFHSGNWRPSLGMTGFAREAVNGLICWEILNSGIRVLELYNRLRMKKSLGTEGILAEFHRQRASLAADSRKYNDRRHPELVRLFAQYEALYPGAEACRHRKMRRAVLQALAFPDPCARVDELLEILPDALGPLWRDAGAAATDALVGGDPLRVRALMALVGERDPAWRPLLAQAFQALGPELPTKDRLLVLGEEIAGAMGKSSKAIRSVFAAVAGCRSPGWGYREVYPVLQDVIRGHENFRQRDASVAELLSLGKDLRGREPAAAPALAPAPAPAPAPTPDPGLEAFLGELLGSG